MVFGSPLNRCGRNNVADPVIQTLAQLRDTERDLCRRLACPLLDKPWLFPMSAILLAYGVTGVALILLTHSTPSLDYGFSVLSALAVGWFILDALLTQKRYLKLRASLAVHSADAVVEALKGFARGGPQNFDDWRFLLVNIALLAVVIYGDQVLLQRAQVYPETRTWVILLALGLISVPILRIIYRFRPWKPGMA